MNPLPFILPLLLLTLSCSSTPEKKAERAVERFFEGYLNPSSFPGIRYGYTPVSTMVERADTVPFADTAVLSIGKELLACNKRREVLLEDARMEARLRSKSKDWDERMRHERNISILLEAVERTDSVSGEISKRMRKEMRKNSFDGYLCRHTYKLAPKEKITEVSTLLLDSRYEVVYVDSEDEPYDSLVTAIRKELGNVTDRGGYNWRIEREADNDN